MLDNLVLYSLGIGIVGLAVAFLTYTGIKRHDAGSQVMRDLADQIHTGAMAFLRREYLVLLPFLVVIAGLLSWAISWETAVAYVIGGVCSVLAGFAGMQAATIANVRTSEAARAEGQAAALRIAFGGGSVMGLAVASLVLLGIAGVYMWLTGEADTPESVRVFSETISGFAMGASSIALFARVGVGIYTKAADVGADLVGKVEAGIPEDDVRNPATIADNVGDNVGDVAGMGADLFGSYVATILATMVLGQEIVVRDNLGGLSPILLPMVISGLGLLAS